MMIRGRYVYACVIENIKNSKWLSTRREERKHNLLLVNNFESNQRILVKIMLDAEVW